MDIFDNLAVGTVVYFMVAGTDVLGRGVVLSVREGGYEVRGSSGVLFLGFDEIEASC